MDMKARAKQKTNELFEDLPIYYLLMFEFKFVFLFKKLNLPFFFHMAISSAITFLVQVAPNMCSEREAFCISLPLERIICSTRLQTFSSGSRFCLLITFLILLCWAEPITFYAFYVSLLLYFYLICWNIFIIACSGSLNSRIHHV